jgi:hypothetical protein
VPDTAVPGATSVLTSGAASAADAGGAADGAAGPPSGGAAEAYSRVVRGVAPCAAFPVVCAMQLELIDAQPSTAKTVLIFQNLLSMKPLICEKIDVSPLAGAGPA